MVLREALPQLPVSIGDIIHKKSVHAGGKKKEEENKALWRNCYTIFFIIFTKVITS